MPNFAIYATMSLSSSEMPLVFTRRLREVAVFMQLNRNSFRQLWRTIVDFAILYVNSLNVPCKFDNVLNMCSSSSGSGSNVAVF
ncbi:hypothetical protein ANAPH1_00844 [Anaplasma phagocytophilum]|nr:hypothetical protein ANAPH1_00844 [Anaplasma phagocytophilum]